MKFLQLLESFKDYAPNNKGELRPIFYANNEKDFSLNELQEVKQWDYGFRFIYVAAKNPILYVFPSDLTHEKASEALNINYKEYWKNKETVFFGEGLVSSKGEWRYEDSYILSELGFLLRGQVKTQIDIAKKVYNKLSVANWSLLTKYIKRFLPVITQIKSKNEELNKD